MLGLHPLTRSIYLNARKYRIYIRNELDPTDFTLSEVHQAGMKAQLLSLRNLTGCVLGARIIASL